MADQKYRKLRTRFIALVWWSCCLLIVVVLIGLFRSHRELVQANKILSQEKVQDCLKKCLHAPAESE